MDTATESQLFKHLLSVDPFFVPPLSTRVDIKTYAKKLSLNAIGFEAWVEGTLAGMINIYIESQGEESPPEKAFISNVSLLKEYQGRGLAQHLLNDCLAYCREKNILWMTLVVDRENIIALSFYQKNGFTPISFQVNESNQETQENIKSNHVKLNQVEVNQGEVQLVLALEEL